MAEENLYDDDSTNLSYNQEPRPAFQCERGTELYLVKGERGYGGYRKDILTENLNERDKAGFVCTICQGIMKEACIASSGEQFCFCCGSHFSKETPDMSVRKMINSLKCSCPLIERGCQWLGTLKDCENHLETCGYVYETCKLGCGVVLRRDKLTIHEKEKCPRRKVKCSHCKKDSKSCKLNEHLNKCPFVKVTCDLCSVVNYRKDMTEHLKDYCPENMIDCPFVKYKCVARMKRKDIDKHLKEKETKHLRLKLTAIEDLVNKQSEVINIFNEIIHKQSELLYSITDTTKIIWKIEGATDLIKGNHLLESEPYQVDGYSFRFHFHQNTLSTIFPETTSKYSKPFIAKSTILLLSKQIKCGTVEVKQKDLTRGCNRTITSISEEDVEKYSEHSSPGDTKKNLTLEIYLTMQ